MRRFVFCLAAVVSAIPASADVIHLRDGAMIEGTARKEPDGWVITDARGKVTHAATDAVKSIELTGAPVASTKADDKLASLRRSIEYTADIRQIIDRYARFIDQNANTSTAEEARKDLAVWQDRLARGLVKVGNQWLTPAQKTAIQEKSLAAADDVRRLLKAGRMNEADAALTKVLAGDPSNPSLLFLKALLLYRQDQLIASRKFFEAANAQLPNHAPTLNNLAIIAQRQNQVPAALNYYDQAMLASPENRQVLNNVAEAIYVLPPDVRNATVAQKTARHFIEQDASLARKLEKEGLFRWGSTWVSGRQLEQLRVAEKEVRDKLDSLAAEFDATKVRINNIDRDTEDNERAMRRMEARSYAYGSDGIPYRVGLPSTYYELQRDNEKLKTDRDNQFAHLDELREKARTIQNQLPIPKYTGIQRLIDVEGTPFDIASAVLVPATQATTQPTTTKS